MDFFHVACSASTLNEIFFLRKTCENMNEYTVLCFCWSQTERLVQMFTLSSIALVQSELVAYVIMLGSPVVQISKAGDVNKTKILIVLFLLYPYMYSVITTPEWKNRIVLFRSILYKGQPMEGSLFSVGLRFKGVVS